MIGSARGVIIPLCAAAVVCLLASCSSAPSQPVLSRAEITGTWTSPADGSFTFFADHSFSARALNLSAFYGKGCSGISGTGTWDFLSPQGTGGPGPPFYSRGKLLSLFFATPVASGCGAGALEVTSWSTSPGVNGLCMSFDPDSPCTGQVFTKDR